MTALSEVRGRSAMHRMRRSLFVVRCRPVKPMTLNIGNRRGVFKHDDVLDVAAYSPK